MEDNISLDHVQNNDIFNFKSVFHKDNQNSIYDTTGHICKYYSSDEFLDKSCNLPNSNFSIFSLNIRSLPGKWHELQTFLSTSVSKCFKFSVICLQEIWSVPGSFDLPGYSPLEFSVRDRGLNSNAGGGVGLWIDSSFKFEYLLDLSIFIPKTFESQFYKIQISNKEYFIIGNIYRPNTGPQASIKRFNSILSDILSNIRKDTNLNNGKIILLGDININLLNFEIHQDTNEYLDLLLANELLPLITLPTRINHRTATLIDHICTNINDTVYDTGIICNDLSDHFGTFYIMNTRSRLKEKPLPSYEYNMNNSNKLAFKNMLRDTDWTSVFEESNVDRAFDNFFQLIDSCFTASFPRQLSRNNNKSIPLNPWMSPGLLTSRKAKEKLHRKKIKNPTPVNSLKYKNYNNLYTKLCRLAKKLYYTNKFKEYSRDGKRTWQTINKVLGRTLQKDSLPSTFVSNENILSDKFDIVEGFNNFFADVGPKLATKIPQSKFSFADFLSGESSQSFTFQNITPEILRKALSKLKNKNSAGPDKISTNLLKYVFDNLTNPLCYLFNLSFKSGIVPNCLKVSKCVPVFKSGNPQDFSNYRPISLISCFAKLQEKIVSLQMMKYLNKFNILFEHQYGFRANHSTMHPLIHFLNKINNSLNMNSPEFTLGIFIDLKKAFDTCNFNILLSKLNHYGFRGISNCWFHSYLHDRQQYTFSDGISSSLRSITCGVPQGSILGPILFLLFINDLANSSKLLFILLFADDTTLQLSSSNIYELYNIANKELSIVSEWFKANKLTLNISKTKYILFRRSNMYADFPNLSLSIDNCPIERIGIGCNESSFKFVGVKIDEFLSWKDHITCLKSKLSSVTFALSKVKNLLPEKTKCLIYNSLFKSHLDYCNIAWGKSNNNLISQLLVLQKRALRYVANVKSNAHADPLYLRYKCLNVRDMTDFNMGIFMYQYTHKSLPCSFENIFQQLQNHDRNLNYVTHRVRSSCLKSNPLNILPVFWNSLCLELKRSSTLNVFKKRLYKSLQEKYISKCNIQNCFACN